MCGEKASETRQRKWGQVCSCCNTWLGGPIWPPIGPRCCAECEPRPHKVLVTFVPSRQTNGGYRVHFMAEDCRTPISRFYDVASKESLRAMLVRTQAGDEVLSRFDHAQQTWGQGSVWLRLTERERRRLG